MSRRRDVGTPPSLDFAEAMGERYSTPVEPEPARPATPSKPAAPAPRQQETTRRSWLLPREIAEAFAAAADRIHHASSGRVSKSEAQAALMRAGVEREDEITRNLIGNER